MNGVDHEKIKQDIARVKELLEWIESLPTADRDAAVHLVNHPELLARQPDSEYKRKLYELQKFTTEPVPEDYYLLPGPPSPEMPMHNYNYKRPENKEST